jgi:hypothetical protein
LASDLSDPSGLADSLMQAVDSYRETWEPVDAELYQLCRRRSSHQAFADVYTKVAIIGRTYAAGISRTVRADGDPEAAVARGLMYQGEPINEQLSALATRRFDWGLVSAIIELHAQVVRGLLPFTAGVWQQSFVSKYLHFHCEIVPVYDSRDEAAIGRFVSWPVVYAAREALGRPEDWLTSYYNFATAFMVLYEEASASSSTQLSVKELDYLLWRPAPRSAATA